MRPDTRRFNKRTVTSASEDISLPQAVTHARHSTNKPHAPCTSRAQSLSDRLKRRPDPRVTTKGRDRRYALYQGKSRHTLGTTEYT